MKFTRTTYPELAGRPALGAPCWRLTGRWIYLDADWNTRFPFGTSWCLRIGPSSQPGHHGAPGFTLDLNPPLGEPNRLYLFLGRWFVILGLPTLRTSQPTGEKVNGVAVYRDCLSWPRLGSTGRYRYHRRDDGRWVRNSKPEPRHWGWLTVERRASRC